MDPLAAIAQPAPNFSLPDLQGRTRHLSDQLGQIVVLNFWSAECPWVQRVDGSLTHLRSTWPPDVVYWPIASNVNESPEEIAAAAALREMPIVLLDGEQSVADLYRAVTTPHFFVIDHEGMLRYSGAYDDVSFRQREATRSYLEQAVAALLEERQPDPAETPPYGCAMVRHSV
jgi:peroxiredoxin